MVVVVLVAIVMGSVSGPAVARVEHGVGTKDGSALVRKVGNIGELVAVKLKHTAQLRLLSPLAVQAVTNISHILVKNLDLGFVQKGLVAVSGNLGGVLGNFLLVVLDIVLSLGDSLSELEDLKSEGLNGDDLIGVDVNLLGVALLVSEGTAKVEVVHGVVVALGHDGARPATLGTGLSSGGGGGLSGDCGGGSGVSLQVNGGSRDSKGGEGGSEFHFVLVISIIFISGSL
jgi:hypothetical protein